MRRLASSFVLGFSLVLAGSIAASAQTTQQPAAKAQSATAQPAKKKAVKKQAPKAAPAQANNGWQPLETVPVTGERTPGYVGIGQKSFSQPYDNTAAGQANQGLPSPYGMGNNIMSQPTR